ncbi:MAG: SagB/ThcOx family dehydrogenase [Promethearchaeota archaeon]
MDIQLPNPKLKGIKSLEECIYERESVRKFKDQSIELEKLSQLMWAAQGLKGRKRTVPSAGATYPLEIYLIMDRKKLYHYLPKTHVLKFIKEEENLCKNLASYSWNQDFMCQAPLIIVICAQYSRTCHRYGDRGIRYVHMEIGHCAQNIHLQAVSLGLDSVPIGAFDDEKLKRLLGVPEEIEVLYLIPIGYKR